MNIYMVEDQKFSEQVEDWLEDVPDMHILGIVTSVSDFKAVSSDVLDKMDVLLMDIMLPETGTGRANLPRGEKLGLKFKAAHPSVGLLFMSGEYKKLETIIAAIDENDQDIGMGFISKGNLGRGGDLIDAIRMVSRGTDYLHPRLYKEYLRENPLKNAFNEDELFVLKHVALGYVYGDIERKLGEKGKHTLDVSKIVNEKIYPRLKKRKVTIGEYPVDDKGYNRILLTHLAIHLGLITPLEVKDGIQ